MKAKNIVAIYDNHIYFVDINNKWNNYDKYAFYFFEKDGNNLTVSGYLCGGNTLKELVNNAKKLYARIYNIKKQKEIK